MAANQGNSNNSGNKEKKRGPGRPPGSKNKPKENKADASGPSRQEVIDEIRRRNDRDKRNLDIIWSITLFAIGLFLFFTVVMDTTGSFGQMVHDFCNGLFGIMALVLPFLVFLFAFLLLAGRLQHIGVRTFVFSFLIFINMCILNSYRFLDVSDLRYGFPDIADYFVDGIDGRGGGAFGMELGSLLAKFFGMPGLIIISLAVLFISIFLVANTPISRFVSKLGKHHEERMIIRELEKDEQMRLSDGQIRAALAGEAGTSAPVPAAAAESGEKRSIWRSILSGITRDEPVETVPDFAASGAEKPDVLDIPKPFGEGRTNKDKIDDIDYTQIITTPVGSQEKSYDRKSLFGRFREQYLGIDSESGETITTKNVGKPASDGKRGLSGDSPSDNMYSENRDFESAGDDYGYPGRRSDREKAKPKTGYGLGDPNDTGGSGSYGLDAHGESKKTGQKRSAGTAASAASSASAPSSDADPAAERAGRAASKAAKASSSAAAAGTVSKESRSRAQAPDQDDAKAGYDKAEEEQIAAGFSASADDACYELPPVSLLKKDTGSKQLMSNIQLEEKADLLEQTLNNFGVDAKVLTVTQGASVTRYEVQPAVGVKVSKITSLADDIALNMRAKSIRIEAPIPGKAAVGIEVENDKPSPVFIRDLIESEEFTDAPSRLTFVVGKDISGNNIVADLRDMPHMLIAGATGSGKSVCINSIITSFLYKARPSELKLIMIDPKVVELGNYNGIPHMLTPVVTDPRKASRALAIAVEEMDRRYELFAENNVKDLESFNELMRANQRYADCKPQIVIIIDELADLMMAAPSEVENSICRLAQKARAAGMHLIVATQRPSVDVVTGLIKANIPSRIAFSVASQFDSRTILDMAGAEKLLGKGDMLFSPVGSTKPYRVQGPFISEKETDKIIKFVKKEGGDPSYDDEIQKAIESDGKRGGAEPQDELTEDAIAFIFKSKQASVSMLQRRFRIGYNRAARIIDEIEEKGIIGPSDGSRPRQLLITEDEYYGIYDSDASAAEPEPAPEPQPQPSREAASAPLHKAPSAAVNADSDADAPEVSTGGAGPKNAASAGENASAQGGRAAVSDGSGQSRLSNTQAMDSFNSLPESVRRMVMDADSESDY